MNDRMRLVSDGAGRSRWMRWDDVAGMYLYAADINRWEYVGGLLDDIVPALTPHDGFRMVPREAGTW